MHVSYKSLNNTFKTLQQILQQLQKIFFLKKHIIITLITRLVIPLIMYKRYESNLVFILIKIMIYLVDM